METEIDFYELLEVERSADDKTIKSAYRKLAMRFHPDRNPGDADAEARFKAISRAYDCLKDPQKRAAYDRFGHAAYEQAASGGGGHGGGQGFSDIGDIFETIFGSAFGGASAGGRQRRGARTRPGLSMTRLAMLVWPSKKRGLIQPGRATNSMSSSGTLPVSRRALKVLPMLRTGSTRPQQTSPKHCSSQTGSVTRNYG